MSSIASCPQQNQERLQREKDICRGIRESWREGKEMKGGGGLGVHVSTAETNLIFQDHLLPVPELKAPFMSFLPLPHKQSRAGSWVLFSLRCFSHYKPEPLPVLSVILTVKWHIYGVKEEIWMLFGRMS